MSDCAARDAFLDQTLGAAERAAFETHAAGCAQCQAALQGWRDFGASLKAAYGPLHDSPLAGELARLKAKATQAREPRRPLAWALGAVAVVAVTVVAVVALRPPPEQRWEAQVVASLDATASAAVAETTGAGGALLKLGEDEVGLGPNSKVKFKRAGSRGTELELQRGTLAARVNAHGKRSFDVVTPLGRVHVVGTVFRVAAGERLEVEVLEGVVEVSEPSGRVVRVKAGQRWAGDELAPFSSSGFTELLPPQAIDAGAAAAAAIAAAANFTEPKAPDAGVRAPARSSLSELRSRAARGECRAVVVELEQLLRVAASSADGWLLLGDCRRREGKAQSAVEAYLRAAKSQDADGERGLLLAASLLQDELARPAEALRALDQYLARKPETRALEAAALVRQGRAWLALRNPKKAQALFNKVIARFPDTPAAAEANQLRGGP